MRGFLSILSVFIFFTKRSQLVVELLHACEKRSKQCIPHSVNYLLHGWKSSKTLGLQHHHDKLWLSTFCPNTKIQKSMNKTGCFKTPRNNTVEGVLIKSCHKKLFLPTLAYRHRFQGHTVVNPNAIIELSNAHAEVKFTTVLIRLWNKTHTITHLSRDRWVPKKAL